MKIELNTDEVREIMEAYFQSIGAPVEIKSIMVTYEQVVMDATLNPQPTAAPRQCVEPASYNLPPIEPVGSVHSLADSLQVDCMDQYHAAMTSSESATHIHMDAAGRIMSEDEVRELHK